MADVTVLSSYGVAFLVDNVFSFGDQRPALFSSPVASHTSTFRAMIEQYKIPFPGWKMVPSQFVNAYILIPDACSQFVNAVTIQPDIGSQTVNAPLLKPDSHSQFVNAIPDSRKPVHKL